MLLDTLDNSRADAFCSFISLIDRQIYHFERGDWSERRNLYSARLTTALRLIADVVQNDDAGCLDVEFVLCFNPCVHEVFPALPLVGNSTRDGPPLALFPLITADGQSIIDSGEDECASPHAKENWRSALAYSAFYFVALDVSLPGACYDDIQLVTNQASAGLSWHSLFVRSILHRWLRGILQVKLINMLRVVKMPCNFHLSLLCLVFSVSSVLIELQSDCSREIAEIRSRCSSSIPSACITSCARSILSHGKVDSRTVRHGGLRHHDR